MVGTFVHVAEASGTVEVDLWLIINLNVHVIPSNVAASMRQRAASVRLMQAE